MRHASEFLSKGLALGNGIRIAGVLESLDLSVALPHALDWCLAAGRWAVLWVGTGGQPGLQLILKDSIECRGVPLVQMLHSGLHSLLEGLDVR